MGNSMKNNKVLYAVGIVAMLVGLGIACESDRTSGYYECPDCKEKFTPKMLDYLKGVHTFSKRQLKCPTCGAVNMCKHVIR